MQIYGHNLLIHRTVPYGSNGSNAEKKRLDKV